MIGRIMRGALGGVALLAVLLAVQIFRNSGDTEMASAPPEALRFGTYNVHYIVTRRESGPWSLGDWARRKGPLDLAFKAMEADLVAFQEMESFAGRGGSPDNLTLSWLLENNPDYAAAAVGDVAEFPSTQPILYRTARLEALDQGWFFFSDTPDVIYARTYDGSYPAFASWVVFRDLQRGAVFRVVNVHTDYASRSNRLQSVALVAARMAPWIAADETVFVTGDFNARRGDVVVDVLEEAGIAFATVRGATFHFNRGLNLFGAIDHIGVSGGAQLVGEPGVLRRKFAGEWPTDHYPVVADYVLDGRDP